MSVDAATESDPLHVLLVEDNPAQAKLLTLTLRRVRGDQTYEVTHAATLGEALAALDGETFDAQLLDLSLPDSAGLATVQRALAHPKAPPTIVLTGHDDQELALSALQAGAQDYLTKGALEGGAVLRALRYALERSRLSRERAAALRNAEARARELEETLERLKQSEATLKQAQEIARLGSFCWDLEQGELSWSEQMFALVGLDPRSHQGSAEATARAMLHPDDAAYVIEQIAKMLEERRTWPLEYRIKRTDGEERWMRVAARFVMNDEGSPRLCLGVQQDITEQRWLRAQVAQDDRMASVGLLAAGVAHEINNPLTYVLYNVQRSGREVPILSAAVAALASALGIDKAADILDDPRVLDSSWRAAMAERLSDAADGAERVERIVKDLRTFSRAADEALETVCLNDIIDGALNMARNELRFRASVVKDLRPLPTFDANGGRVAQVFLNLLLNAAHAIEEGNVADNAIRLRSWSDDQRVFAQVSDTGKGIPAAHLPRIFEAFFTTKPQGEGSGLGLSICKDIVEDLGGTISVTSEVGKGTCFTLAFPIARRDRRPPTSPQAPLPSPAMEGRRRRFLVVDDEPNICTAVAQILGEHHEVVPCAAGTTARAVLSVDRNFDLIICDLMMPQVSGMDLHGWVENQDPELAQRFLFMTGGAFTPRAKAFLASRTTQPLHKPFSDGDLLARVESLLRLHDGRQS